MAAERDASSATLRLASLAAAVTPAFACYVATASSEGYWLDSGEFTAAGIGLGIAHPPGQPLAALVIGAVQRIPLGSLSFRAALASAICAALAAAAIFRAAETSLRAVGARSPTVSVPLALGATWLVTGAAGFWLQAVRPEVYALQAAVMLVALERLVALEADWPPRGVRPLYTAAFAFGLCLANHHFLALLLLPAAAPTLARLVPLRSRRPLWLALGATAAGLSTYLYLPIRAAAGASPNLGNPSSIGRFWWVVSAQVFQKSADPSAALTEQPLHERVLDVVIRLVEDLHPAVPILALAGLYAALRTPTSRRIGLLWGILLVVCVFARGWLGFVRGNPDAQGYLLPAYVATAVLAACIPAALAKLIDRARRLPLAGAVVGLLVMAGGVFSLARGSGSASLADFHATTAFEDESRMLLPPRSVVIAWDPGTIFLATATDAETHVRPDLDLVPVPWLDYPGGLETVANADPSLRDLVTSYALRGSFSVGELQSLAARRPVYTELDPRLSRDAWRTTVPAGLFSEVLTDPASRDDRRLASRDVSIRHAALRARLGPEVDEHETRRRLLWRNYMDALYFAYLGDRAQAFESIVRARRIAPREELARRLELALRRRGRGPIDIEPFIPGD